MIFSSPSQKTTVKVFYNDNSLYFAVKIYDEVDEIEGNRAQYDDWFEGFESSSDYFIIELDSYHDHRTSYAFAVNSMGVKADYMIYDDSPNMIDDDWNQKWNSAVFKDIDGWNIEFEIPFKILRFNNPDKMGVNFIRYIKRNNEYISWVVMPREIEGLVSHYGHLCDMDIKKNKYIFFKPYLLFGATSYDDYYYIDIEEDVDNFNIINQHINPEMIGLDLQYNVNNFSTFSMTINPDFGQIEQDPSEINLTAYETYFEEKRSFFIESSNLFKTPIDIFYSRRIGSRIKLNSNLNDLNDNYYNSNLDIALKLTGKNNNGLSYGVLATQSEIDSSYSRLDNQKIHTSAFRVSKDILDGNSYFGFMDVYYKDIYNESNIISIDGLFNFIDNKLNFDTQVINSMNKNNNASGLSFELSFKDKLSNIVNNNISNKILETWLNVEVYDDDLDINNTGYLYRNDLRKMIFGISLINQDIENQSIFKKNAMKNYLLYFQSTIAKKRFSDLRLVNSSSINWKATFNNFWYFNIGLIKGLEYFDDRLYDYYLDQIQSSLVLKKPSYQQIYFSFGNSPSNDYSFNISTEYFSNKIRDNGFSYSFSTVLRPANWINLELSYNLDKNKEKYHFLKVRKLSNNGIREDEIYEFTASENLEKYITSRASVFLKNNISLQLYMEYYVNKNRLSENENDLSILGEGNNYEYPISSPASTLDENYNLLYRTNYSSLTTNFVFKWEYKQGSNLYFVYSIYKDVSGISFNDLIDLIKYEFNSENKSEIFFDRSVYIKADYWFDF